RKDVEELELVVEVVLEPEDHLEISAERLEQLPVARSNEESSACCRPQPQSARKRARVRSSSRLGSAGTGRSWSVSCHGSTAPPSVVCRSVLPALSPLVMWRSCGRDVGVAPRRARYAAPQVQWSSEMQAQPTTRAASSRMRRSAAPRVAKW